MKQLWYMLQPGWTLKTLSLSRRQEGHTGPNHPVCFKSTKVSKRRENVSSTCRKRKPNHRGERLSHNWGKGEGEGWRWRVKVKGGGEGACGQGCKVEPWNFLLGGFCAASLAGYPSVRESALAYSMWRGKREYFVLLHTLFYTLEMTGK